jgi:uncharacterized protein (DUF111 family)
VAEGKIHGHPPEQVHFHEVGAIDSIVDIVGACVALEMLGKPRVLASNPIEGTGTIRCAHGTFPIPAPATLEILSARGVAIQQCDEPGELITPTGAAILAEFVESFGSMQNLAPEKIGYGLGTRQNQTRPNVLRALLGEQSKVQSPKSKVGAALDLGDGLGRCARNEPRRYQCRIARSVCGESFGGRARSMYSTRRCR